MTSINSLKDLKNKKVLVRVDFNVPIKRGRILDGFRIKAVLPTIKYLQRKKAKIILISHLGSQNSKHEARNSKLSLRPVAKYLKIKFVDDCLGRKTEEAIKKLRGGEIILLENLRFYSGEKNNDRKFARKLASLGDLYVNEAFSVCHRADTSIVSVPKFLPSFIGLRLEEEIRRLRQALKNPSKPLVVIFGGAKISTKLCALKKLAKKADHILLGGAMANNFLKASGFRIGDSVYEENLLDETKAILGRYEKKIVLPIDLGMEIRGMRRNIEVKDLDKIKGRFKILDIGPDSTKLFSLYLKKAKTIVFNGPMGFFEKNSFTWGTKKIVESILKNKKAQIIIGGGETIAALPTKIKNKNLFISTGGGAMLDFLSGKKLPGFKPLMSG